MNKPANNVWANGCDATWGRDPLHLCDKLKDHAGPCVCRCGERKP